MMFPEQATTMALFTDKDFETIKFISDLPASGKSVVITCHLSPDGDAMGSSLALAGVLENMGMTVHVITPDEANGNLRSLPGAGRVLSLTGFPNAVERYCREAGLIFCLDYNELKRLSRLEPFVRQSQAVKVLIDHHTNPRWDDFTMGISKPDRSSTCSLLYSVLEASGLLKYVDKDAATCIMAGMMTDTHNFSYNANRPEDYVIQSELVGMGVDKNALYNKLFNTFSENCMRLNGYALSEKMRVYGQYHCALISLQRDELNRYHYAKGYTEGLVNRPLAIPGIVCSCYLREESDYVKVSMRSVGDCPVNIICNKYFGGGGHLNAAGGEFYGTLKEAEDLFESLLPVICNQYIKKS